MLICFPSCSFCSIETVLVNGLVCRDANLPSQEVIWKLLPPDDAPGTGNLSLSKNVLTYYRCIQSYINAGETVETLLPRKEEISRG